MKAPSKSLAVSLKRLFSLEKNNCTFFIFLLVVIKNILTFDPLQVRSSSKIYWSGSSVG